MAKHVEFLAKVRKRKVKQPLSEEEQAYRESLRIIGKVPEEDEEDGDDEEVGFKRIILDLELVADVVELEKGYIQVFMKYGVVYILNIDYHAYKQLYQKLLQIYILEHVKE